MSVRQTLTEMRDALVLLLPHATHTLRCTKHPCTCHLDRAIATARELIDRPTLLPRGSRGAKRPPFGHTADGVCWCKQRHAVKAAV